MSGVRYCLYCNRLHLRLEDWLEDGGWESTSSPLINQRLTFLWSFEEIKKRRLLGSTLLELIHPDHAHREKYEMKKLPAVLPPI